MRTFNQTIGADNLAIWFYKCYLSDGSMLYFTDYKNSLTLSYGSLDITYDGKSTKKEENILETVYDFSNGGDIGSIATIAIELSRNSENVDIKDFQNDFFPNTDKYLTNSRWEVGIGWEGITDEEEITWLYEMYCQNTEIKYNSISLTLYTYDFYNVELPRHVAQKENSNIPYYYSSLPDDVVGTPIPLLYGRFTITSFDCTQTRLAYTICVNQEEGYYIYASHKCRNTIYRDYDNNLTEYTTLTGAVSKYLIFRYVDSAKNYLQLSQQYQSDSTAANLWTNAVGESSLRILNSPINYTVIGHILLNNFIVHKRSSVKEKLDYDKPNSNIIELLASERLMIQLNSSLSDSDLGTLGIVSSDISLGIDFQSKTGANVNLKMSYYNDYPVNTYSTFTYSSTTNTGGTWATAYLNMGDNISAKLTSGLPFQMTDLLSYGYMFENQGDSSTTMRISRITMTLKNILLAHTTTGQGSFRV